MGKGRECGGRLKRGERLANNRNGLAIERGKEIKGEGERGERCLSLTLLQIPK